MKLFIGISIWFVVLAMMLPAQPVLATVHIFFICKSSDAAKIVAYNIGDAVPGVTELPSGCRWLNEFGQEESMANIIEIIEPVKLADGRVVYIAHVQRGGVEHGYSAGYLELALS